MKWRRGRNTKKAELSFLFCAPATWQKTITATLQCAGNRRKHLESLKTAQGTPWDCGMGIHRGGCWPFGSETQIFLYTFCAAAISTATFTGVRLRDVLVACGIELDDEDLPLSPNVRRTWMNRENKHRRLILIAPCLPPPPSHCSSSTCTLRAATRALTASFMVLPSLPSWRWVPTR